LDICHLLIQLGRATVEFVFAPEERDVYSYERTPKDLAPPGAKSGTGTFALAQNAIALLRSFGVKIRTVSYKHLAPMGRTANNVLLHFQVESANDK